MKMTTEEAFVKTLQMHGIRHAFGIIGSAMMPISDIFPKAGIMFWDCAHEGNDAYTLKQLFADFRKRLPAKREEQLMQALTSEERQAMLLLFFKLFVDPNWSQYFELMRRTKALFVQTNNSSATTSKYVKNEIYFIVDMLNFWRDEFYVIGQQYDSIVSWLPTSIIVPKQLLPGNSGQGAVRGQGGQSGGNGQNGPNNDNKAKRCRNSE